MYKGKKSGTVVTVAMASVTEFLSADFHDNEYCVTCYVTLEQHIPLIRWYRCIWKERCCNLLLRRKPRGRTFYKKVEGHRVVTVKLITE